MVDPSVECCHGICRESNGSRDLARPVTAGRAGNLKYRPLHFQHGDDGYSTCASGKQTAEQRLAKYLLLVAAILCRGSSRSRTGNRHLQVGRLACASLLSLTLMALVHVSY